MTELVNDRMTDGYFTNPRFVARLDIRFASLYLEALPAPVPTAAWAPVFELRHAPDRLPIQYALAGMNAHINHDLPLAVVAAWGPPDGSGEPRRPRRLPPGQRSARQRPGGGAPVVPRGLALEVDRTHTAPVANLVGAWSINRARDAA